MLSIKYHKIDNWISRELITRLMNDQKNLCCVGTQIQKLKPTVFESGYKKNLTSPDLNIKKLNFSDVCVSH
jgi:hypothetical protein